MELRYTACSAVALYRFAHLRPIETFKVEQGRHISSDKRPIFAYTKYRRIHILRTTEA